MKTNTQIVIDAVECIRDCAIENTRDLMADCDNEFETFQLYDDAYHMNNIITAIKGLDDCWVDEIVDHILDAKNELSRE